MAKYSLKAIFCEDSEDDFSTSRSRNFLISLKEKSDAGEFIFAHWSDLPNHLGPKPLGGEGGGFPTPWGLYAYRLDGRTLGALGIRSYKHPHARSNLAVVGKETGFERSYVHIFKVDPGELLFLSDRYDNWEQDRKFLLKFIEQQTKANIQKAWDADYSKTAEEVYEEEFAAWQQKLPSKEMSQEEIDKVAKDMAEIAKLSHQKKMERPERQAEERLQRLIERAGDPSNRLGKIKSKGELVYRITNELVNDNPRKWSLILKQMGYNGVYDDGNAGIYYGSEPDQLVLFTTRGVKKIGTFTSATHLPNKSFEKSQGRIVRVESMFTQFVRLLKEDTKPS